MAPSKLFERSYLVALVLSCCFFLFLWHGSGHSQDQGFDKALRKRAYKRNTCDYETFAAVAVLKGASAVTGTVKFRQEGPVTYITGTIQGLDKSALRGMHIHTLGDLTNGCNSTGVHYNPKNVTHGDAPDPDGHVGDLGNIQSDDQGVAQLNITSTKIRLDGRFGVVGRALVVHTGTDDLGTVDNDGSRATGNSGGRAACGIIGIADPTAPTP